MFQKVINRANRHIKVSTAAGLLAASYLASGILGLIRDRLLAARFGIGGTLDAYFSAFSIPDLVFYLLVTGALAVTFIPVITERIVHNNRNSAWELASSLINFLAIITFIASVGIFIFADPLMRAVAPAFDPTRHDLAVTLTRILAINPFLFSISSVLTSMQQAFGRFFFYALAPIVYNLGIIFGIIGLSPHMGIEGVAIGAVIGAALQMLIQQFGLIGLGFKYQLKIFWRNIGFRRVLRLMVPRAIDEGVEHLGAVIQRAIASGLAVGSVAAYQYAFNLKNLPITLIGITIATAVFPKFAEGAASTRIDVLKKQVGETMRVMLWLLLPVAGLVAILRGYIVRLLFGFGNPTTASILGWFAAAIVFQSVLRLMARVFYAHQNTRIPLYASLAALALNIPLALWFVHVFDIKGLAIAQSLVALIEAGILMVVVSIKWGNFFSKELLVQIFKMLIASFLTISVGYLLVRYAFPLVKDAVGFWTLAPKFIAVSMLSGITYLFAGWALRLPEAELIIEKILRFIFRGTVVKQ